MGSLVSAYWPGPASLTAATRNSYGLPSVRPFTVTLLSGTSSPGVALQTDKHGKGNPVKKVVYSC